MSTIKFNNMGYHVMGSEAISYDEEMRPTVVRLCISMYDGERIYLPQQVIDTLPSATGNWEESDE